jgi:hypothetical protein
VILTIPQCAYVWEANGGDKAHVIVAVAVSSAESSRDTTAISPSSDYGLWQINSSNFGWLGLTATTALEADPNAKAAIRMSGNGTNWAPWCTCWTDPANNCGHGFLPYPQAGSPAYGYINQVAAALHQSPPTPPPGGGGGGGGGGSSAAAQNLLIQMVNDYKTYNNTRLRGSALDHRRIQTVVKQMVQ